MINLTVKKDTFEKNLIPLGYNYKIKQYEDLIESIQRIMFNEVEGSENKKEAVEKVFKEEPSYFVAFDSKQIKYINKAYLVEIIEQGLLDLYLEEQVVIFTDKQLESSYLIKLAEEQNVYASKRYISNKFGLKNKFNLRAKEACRKGIVKEEDYIKNNFYSFLYREVYFSSFEFEVQMHDILSNEENDDLTSILAENNFIFDAVNNGDLNYVKNTVVLEDLKKYCSDWSVSLLARAILNNNIKYVSDITNIMTFRKVVQTSKEEEAITKLIAKVCKLTRKDILDIELVISNEKNEITIRLEELI